MVNHINIHEIHLATPDGKAWLERKKAEEAELNMVAEARKFILLQPTARKEQFGAVIVSNIADTHTGLTMHALCRRMSSIACILPRL